MCRITPHPAKSANSRWQAPAWALLLAAATALSPSGAWAQSEVSAASALSALPCAVAGAVVLIPVALSVAGAVLVVKAVEVGARGSVCVLERTSDGARAT